MAGASVSKKWWWRRCKKMMQKNAQSGSKWIGAVFNCGKWWRSDDSCFALNLEKLALKK